MEDFVSLLNDFEQMGEGQEVMLLFRKLRCILGDRTDLLRDFAAFLHPEQALQCGLVSSIGVLLRDHRCLTEGSQVCHCRITGVSQQVFVCIPQLLVPPGEMFNLHKTCLSVFNEVDYWSVYSPGVSQTY